MRSRLAENSRKEMFDYIKQLSPKERVNAFIEHSRLVALVALAGENLRKKSKRSR